MLRLSRDEVIKTVSVSDYESMRSHVASMNRMFNDDFIGGYEIPFKLIRECAMACTLGLWGFKANVSERDLAQRVFEDCIEDIWCNIHAIYYDIFETDKLDKLKQLKKEYNLVFETGFSEFEKQLKERLGE